MPTSCKKSPTVQITKVTFDVASIPNSQIDNLLLPYLGIPIENALEDLKLRMANYERQYEALDDSEQVSIINIARNYVHIL